jgi:hypothetical protein
MDRASRRGNSSAAKIVDLPGPAVFLELCGRPAKRRSKSATQYTSPGNFADSQAQGLCSNKPLRRKPPRRLSKLRES